MDFLTRLADEQFPTVLVVCFALIFAGAGLAGKIGSRWGYVLMIVPAAFIVYALRVKGLI